MIAGGVLYTSWVLQLLLPSSLSPWTSFASELAASGQPHAWVYRCGDLAAGSLFVLAGLAGLRQRPGAGWRRTGILWLMVVFGLATVIDALCPMSCVTTIDAACSARELAGDVPLTHLVHNATSAVGGAAFWGVVLLAAWRPGRSRMAWLLVVLGAAWIVATIWTLLAQVPSLAPLLLGLAQRVELMLAALWLFAYGVGWLRGHHTAPGGSSPLVTAAAGIPSA